MIDAHPVTMTEDPSLPARLAGALRDVYVMTWRNLVHIAREPLQLSDVTIQPVLFTLLFVYVFGSGIPIPGGIYARFALAGLLLLNLTTSSMGTAVGLTVDLNTGVVDRFRTLPMWQAAVLVGRSVTDVLTAALCTLIIAVSGLVVGWRPETGLGGARRRTRRRAVLRLRAVLARRLRRPLGEERGDGPELRLPGALPALLRLQRARADAGMPGWLRAMADWNPVSAVTAACRSQWGNPNPSAASGAWSMQHPVWTSLAWSLAILVICLPAASMLYRRRTTG